MNKESMYNPYEELPLMPGIDPKYKKYRKFAKMSLLLSFFSFVLATVSLHTSSRHRNSAPHHGGDMTASAVDQALDSQIYSTERCYGEWDYSTQQVYTVPEDDTGLIIGSRLRGSVSGKKTNAKIVLNPELTSPKVTFDLHFSNLMDGDDPEKRVHIDVLNKPQGTFQLTVVVDGYRRDPLCFNYDVTVEMPTLDALQDLSLGVPHSDITVEEAFTFEKHLRLSNAKGDIEFAKEGVRAGILNLSTASGVIHVAGVTVSRDTHLSSASGDIQAGFDNLSGSLTASTASGDVALAVDTLKAGNQQLKMSTASGSIGLKVNTIEGGRKTMSLSSTNGEVDAVLPETFSSDFKLSAIRGRLTVEADDTQQIHYDRKSAYDIRGHYGDANNAAGSVSMSTVTGDITLKYSSQ